jgi:hypothetical protein
MAEFIGEAIHGGEIVARERVDNMWPHLPLGERSASMGRLIEAARRRFAWAPRSLTVQYGQGSDYYYYLTIRIKIPAHVRAEAVQERLRAAENARCACGDTGSWEHAIYGTSGGSDCVWAGCPNCSGQAIGRPILAADLAWYERHTKQTVAG